MKTSGKTTTDHISPAGPWLRYRGHLSKFSENMFMGGINAFTGETGQGQERRYRRDGAGDFPDSHVISRRRTTLGGDRRLQLRRGEQPGACSAVSEAYLAGRR